MLLLRKDRINFAATWNKFRSFNFLFLFLLLSGQNKKLSFGSDLFQPFFYLSRLKRSWTFWRRSLKKFSKLIWKFFFSRWDVGGSDLFETFQKLRESYDFCRLAPGSWLQLQTCEYHRKLKIFMEIVIDVVASWKSWFCPSNFAMKQLIVST